MQVNKTTLDALLRRLLNAESETAATIAKPKPKTAPALKPAR